MLISLFEPDIPQNTGSMLRLCACMGVPLHIIEPCGFVLDDKNLRRVAMDYAAMASVTRHISWQAFTAYKQQTGGRIILLSTRASSVYTEFAFRPDDMLLFGRESSGVPDYVREAADAAVRIPLVAGARSLNLVQAASMVLGEAMRQVGWWSKGVMG